MLLLPVGFDQVFAEKYGVAIAAPIELVGQSSVRHLKVLLQTAFGIKRRLADAALEFRTNFLLFLLSAVVVVVVAFIASGAFGALRRRFSVLFRRN